MFRLLINVPRLFVIACLLSAALVSLIPAVLFIIILRMFIAAGNPDL